MSPLTRPGLIVALALLALPASAALKVTFIEGAPTDRFVITNAGSCAHTALEVVIDLRPSAGRLYFDTTDAGAGVQVFQPFRVAEGNLELVGSAGNRVEDGQTRLTVAVPRLGAGERAAFTIDVDDDARGALGPTRVAGAEIAGARVAVTSPSISPVTGRFDGTGKASVVLPCAAG